MQFFLTRDEIVLLTGRKRLKNQVQWLQQNGIRFVVNAAGLPVVLRATIQEMLGGKPVPKARQRPRFERLN